jgi:hypothetical protein
MNTGFDFSVPRSATQLYTNGRYRITNENDTVDQGVIASGVSLPINPRLNSSKGCFHDLS